MDWLKDKNAWIAIVMIVLGGAYLLKSPSTDLQPEEVASKNEEKIQSSSINSPEKDRKILEAYLDKTALQHSEDKEIWSLLNQFNKKPQEVVNRSNAKQMIPFGLGVMGELLKCIDIDFCGMEKDSEDDPYFDPTGTTAHRTIERALELMITATKIQPDSAQNLDYELLEKVGDIPSERIQALVAELLPVLPDESGNQKDEVKKIESALAKNTNGKSRIALLTKMAKNKNHDRQDFLNLLSNTFAEADAYTVVSVVENLKSLNLSPDELAKSTIYLCRFKVDDYEHNWRAVKRNVENVFPEFSKLCQE